MARKSATAETLETLAPVSNDGERTIGIEAPYIVQCEIQGTAPILFHRWSVEGIAEKAASRKGSAAKKTDDVESYVYRDEDGTLCIPGLYLTRSIVDAARFKQDPRSPRKSARDLFAAGIVPLTELCSLGTKEWDYLDRRRVMVQRNGITRTRPAMAKGWRITVELSCLVPEYIGQDLLHEVTTMAGRLIGLADHRPTYGRFAIVSWKVGPA